MDFMEQKWNLAKLIPVLYLGLLILACDNNSLDNLCADPIGSEGIILRDSSIFCFSRTFDGCFIANFTEDRLEITAIALLGSQEGVIIDVGMINCLGNISDKPANGYSSSVQLILKHGYVIKLDDGTFGRFYADSFADQSDSTSANIIWQYSF